ncbi:MAG: DUF692 domain-containing protein [Porticoccus sp.]|jgi:uncharacterized protein (UPF0276 family)|uniref:DUF692 domain-containing protein n=1 Tax=Porticoccus hydrocarbonoclasticus TaxID=1073414 RepID=UPI00055EEB11|nr:DUF692 domain-containing protein [Porticoccus hydrocarbonoclasticus]MBG57280.1 DUF692 domain-containing protein [Porticoccus sp.]|tara:strand:+ start:19385 stop:20257 length:873 start_codon:yes stop_codon:yes gene_type:complete
MFINEAMGAEMIQVGVGLRSAHYEAAMTPAPIDFVEVHAENFFAEGGVTHDLLMSLSEHYKISLHGTSLGLGSLQPPPPSHLKKMKRLIDRCSPFLTSDHACFSWSVDGKSTVHAGDLLPIRFDKETLQAMTNNIQRVQDLFGRQILIENISSYLAFDGSVIPETEFFNRLCDATGCGLLLDIHNLYVNAHNIGTEQPLNVVLETLTALDTHIVKEIHLAGIHDMTQETWIDDHSGPVSSATWIAYAEAIRRFGAVPTLVEWDTRLPAWPTLIGEASTAASFATKVLDNA